MPWVSRVQGVAAWFPVTITGQLKIKSKFLEWRRDQQGFPRAQHKQNQSLSLEKGHGVKRNLFKYAL